MALGPENYFRLNFKSDFALDDTRPETLKALEKEAQDLIDSQKFNDLIDRLAPILEKRSS